MLKANRYQAKTDYSRDSETNNEVLLQRVQRVQFKSLDQNPTSTKKTQYPRYSETIYCDHQKNDYLNTLGDCYKL